MKIQESGEMYLETILILSQKSPYVRSIDVGEYMGFSKPSVSHAMGLLRSGGYVNMDENGYLTLTEAGAELAGKIYERHRSAWTKQSPPRTPARWSTISATCRSRR